MTESKKVESETEPIMLESMEEFFNLLENKPVLVYPSDDSKYDRLFPDHPLSKVRMLMDEFRQNAKFNGKLANLKPYRVKVR